MLVPARRYRTPWLSFGFNFSVARKCSGGGLVAEFDEGDSEASVGAHGRTGFEEAPEMPGISLEPFSPERLFPGLDARA